MSVFQKRHYDCVAKCFKRGYSTPYYMPYYAAMAYEAVRCMANMFQHDNPKFNRRKFYKACGLEPCD